MSKTEGASPPPTRPRGFSEAGFRPEKPVRWFDPWELIRAGSLALLSDLFGSFADKREVQAALHHGESDPLLQYADESANEDYWFDYVADLGDGFDATYSIAWLLAQPTLRVRGEKEELRRGRLLFMGGDQVYPTASRKEYSNRTVGPYRAALPYLEDESKAPHLYALPGNHDWYDGLSAFLRQFAQKDRWIGAWRTQQTRSYFARKLPRGIWVWGIDIQLRADIDQPQLDYFDAAAKALSPGDSVIVLTAEPSWVKEAEGDHAGYASLRLVMQKVTRAGAKVSLVVTGDSHHYAHYVCEDLSSEGGDEQAPSKMHFVTAGGGGAFLHGTHTLPKTIFLPVSSDPGDTRSHVLIRRETFPHVRVSRSLIRKNIWRFPFINRWFGLVWLGIWSWLALLTWSDGAKVESENAFRTLLAKVPSNEAFELLRPYLIGGGLVLAIGILVRSLDSRSELRKLARSDELQGFGWRLVVDLALWLIPIVGLGALCSVGSPSAFGALGAVCERSPFTLGMVALVPLAAGFYVSRPVSLKSLTQVARGLIGLLYGSLFITSWLLIAALFSRVTEPTLLAALAWFVGVPIATALVSTWLFGCGLWFAGQYRRELLNDAFSAMGIERFKNFLRFKIDPRGNITLFAIGLEKIARRWKFEPQRHYETSFIDPAKPLEPHLIERIEIPASAPEAPESKESGNVAAPVEASGRKLEPVVG